MRDYNYIAFDLGATSGRTMLGSISDGKLSLKEITRFPNSILELNGHYYWNIFSLYAELKRGLKEVSKLNLKIESIGIDTWGVDFAFVGKDGSFMGLPYAYRDPHTVNAPQDYFSNVLSKKEVYRKTGIQVMNFNSLYQFYVLATNNNSQFAAADKMLFIPDALSYMLTGKMVTEYTIASTSQLINPYTKQLDNELLATVGLNSERFGRMVMPGEKIGVLRKELAEECGISQLYVIAVAGHDTASAVVSVPARDENFAYLSSGTWSLMGIETKEPVINNKTEALNISNEGGVEGTIRLLKNITGMWIVEQCLKEWKDQGFDYSYSEMVDLAEKAKSFVAIIDTDSAMFSNPLSMTSAINEYLKRTNQEIPKTHGEYIRMIFESLALKYRKVLDMFSSLSQNRIETLHIIGGGSKNKLLNQFTANSIGRGVVAGPSEATAIGNIMIQAKASGIVSSVSDIRTLISNLIKTELYMPSCTKDWDDNYKKLQNI